MILFIFLAVISISYPQGKNNYLQSPENIKKFADYLFCEKDYLRSIFEYENYLSSKDDDSVKFKLALSYKRMNEFQRSAEIFFSLSENKNFADHSKREYFSSLFQTESYNNFRGIYLSSSADTKEVESIKKLFLLSYLLTDEVLPSEDEYLQIFPNQEIQNLYLRKINPEFKSEFTAAVLSALIPGAGKIYTEQYGDGITAFIATGLLAYLSYSNFRADHDFRGWLFGGLTAFFYAGNIYGSAASAKIFNAGVQISFENDVKLFLNENNYFTPEYDFCK